MALELLGVFLGGALPWLEAVVVVPLGIIGGLPPVAVVIAGASGNLLTVAVAAFAGERVRRWWRTRLRRSVDAAASATGRGSRVERLFERWGLPGLALLGPLGIGTQLSALVAVGFGQAPRRVVAWIGGGTIAWCVVAAVLAVTGSGLAELLR
jgi:hypothetical protein